jgi:hypothetical protein
MRTTYLPHCAVILMTSSVGSCTYIVADSLNNCRFESERFLGYTWWTQIECLEEKTKAGSLRSKVDGKSK